MSERRPHVLIADDQFDNREVLTQLLEEDYRITTATNGAEALAAIAGDRPDVVLLDLNMPVLDGFAVLAHLQREGHGYLPVVVVSAASEREARLRALALGAHEFVTKPIDAEEMRLRVANMVALKLTREALERHNLDLEAVVERRTATLEEANSKLMEQNKYKDEFLSVVSHELRTPLNFIMGFASLMADEVQGPLNTAQLKGMNRILEGSERMLALVNDLLDFARLQAGRNQLSLAEVPYGPLVATVAESLRLLAEKKGLRLEVEVGSDLVACMDESRIAQVLTNLLANAVKFTPQGGAIHVRAYRQGSRIVTEVADTGLGIPLEKREMIFERFAQVDMSATRLAGGTGLGLAISQSLVESHGGTIEVDSQVGVGSTFRFELPCRCGAEGLVPIEPNPLTSGS